MARIIVTSQPSTAHIHLFLPIARAASKNGDDVRFATSPTISSKIEAAGLTIFPAGLEWDDKTIDNVFPGFYELEPKLVPLIFYKEVCASRSAPPFLDDLLRLVADWKPEIVISDGSEFAGPALAAILGIPWVILGFGSGRIPFSALVPLAAESFGNLCTSNGFMGDPAGFLANPDLLIYFVAAPFRVPEAETFSFTRILRPEVFDATVTSDLPPWINELQDRLIIYISLGTVFGTAKRFRTILDAIEGVDAEIILTTGDDINPNDLGKRPDNLHVERYIPNRALLPYVNVLITHGGYTTVMTALTAGIPMLLTPISADHPENAKRCNEIGVGLSASLDEPTTIRAALDRLIVDDNIRNNTHRVAQEIEMQPDAFDGAMMVRDLVRRSSERE